MAIAGLLLVAMAALASPAHALACPDTTGGNSATPIDVTYYLTEGACTKTAPPTGVKMTVRIQDNLAFATFTRPGQANPSVSTSFTTGYVCSNAGDPPAANVARFSYGNSTSCTTTVRLDNGAEFSFKADNDAGGYSSSLTEVSFSVPATKTNLIQPPFTTVFKQTANFTAVVMGGVGPATGVVNFKDGATALGSIGLAAAGGGLSVVSIASGPQSEHACAIMTNATVKCWGRNDRGQLGNNSTDDSSAPVDVQGLTGVVALALGTSHSCALTAAGGVKCWGSNDFGRLGNNAIGDQATPVDVSGLTSAVTAIAVGNGHGCALTFAAGLKCWGLNSDGQLGTGGTASTGLAADVPALTSDVTAIAAGGNHTCAMTTTNGIMCWGDNADGAVGDGTSGTDRLVPTAVPFFSSAALNVAISVGARHSCAIANIGSSSGRPFCWGDNSSGQIGADPALTPRLLSPSASNNLAVEFSGGGIVEISAGSNHTCVRVALGSVRCLGGNASGQLGVGTFSSSFQGLYLGSLDTGVRTIVAANGSSYAVTTGLGAKSWGANAFGRLGDGLSTNRSLPSDVLGLDAGRAAASFSTSALAAGSHPFTATYVGDLNHTGSLSSTRDHTVTKAATTTTLAATPASTSVFGQAVTLTATVTSAAGTPGGTVAFSDNVNGALGTVTLSAGGVATLSTSALSVGAHTITATYSGATNFLVSSGTRAYTVNKAATTTTLTSSVNPSVFGQSVTFTARVTAVSGSAKPTGTITVTDTTSSTVVGGIDLNAITQSKVQAGDGFACSLGSEGGVTCWGNNADGQLGDGTTTNRLTPVAVSGLSSGVESIATGSSHACAVTKLGAVKCWGSNALGQLGDGTTTSRSTPVTVTGMSSGILAVAAGNGSTCAFDEVGKVFCWGDGGQGELGNGGTDNKLAPVPVPALSGGIKAIALGGSTGCAIIASGGLVCWGANALGQVGDGSSVNQLTPVGVFGLDSEGVASVAVGNSHTCAVTTVGAALCWGNNFLGQIGDGTVFGRLTPTPVLGLESGVATINLGSNHSCAVTKAGAVRCWGGNTFGQLGNGGTTDQSTSVAVSGLSSGVSSIAGGTGFTCARTTTGFIRCWGSNSGELGDGTQTERHTPVATLHPVAGLGSFTVQSLSLAGGLHALRATYAGDGNYLTSQSPVLNQTVNKAPNTITFPALANIAFNASPPVPAATASSGLPVSYSSTTTAVCTTTSAGVIKLLSAGTCTIAASQAGNANFLAATTVSRSFTRAKGPNTITFPALASTALGSTPPVPKAVASSSLAVTYSSTTTAVCTATSTGAFTLISVGTCSITASQAGNVNFVAATPVARSFSVAKRTSTTTLTASKNPAALGTSVTLTATAGTGATGNVVFKNGTATIATVALTNGAAATAFTPSVAGTLPITAAYAGDANFNASTSAALKLIAFASCKDGFASALPVAGANASVFGTTVGATGETGEPNHAGNSGALNSVWCTWTAPATGTVTIDTTGSSFNTTLGVYTGTSVAGLTQVAANDNIGPGNSQSRVSFAATAGTAYRIAIDGVSATGAYVLNIALAPPAPVTFASVLPTARSIATGATATAFATMINTGAVAATACSLALPPGFPANFSYQITNATNALTGTPDTPVNIAAGAAQGFFLAVTPLVDLNSTELAIVFDCTNTPTTITVPGLNTLLLSASSTPSPDLISIGSTPSGDGIASIPGATGSTAFGAATINIGAAGTITASVDDNGRGLALTALLCVTNPNTGACTNPATPAASATFALAANASATVAVFVTGTGTVPFDPGANRLFLRFKTADGVTRGATSVAVRTQ
jgi:alpha-tubulin suppressor-like RCC1 family protein